MPHGHAERDACVKLLFRRALWHRVHRAYELVAIESFLVEKGSRARWIKSERFKETVHVFREMIFGLRQIRRKDFVTVVQRNVIVLVLFDSSAKLRDNFFSPRCILGR